MRSIKAKLAILVSTAVLGAVAVGSLAAAWRDADRRLTTKRDELNAMATVLATAVSEPLARADRAAVSRAMTSISRLNEIKYVRVTDAEKRVVVEFGMGIVVAERHAVIEASPALSPLTTLYLGTYPVGTEIVSGGKIIGRLVLIADISPLKRALLDSILSSLSVGLIIALIGIAAAMRLQRRIVDPITSLTSAMRTVGAEKKFDAVSVKAGNDEIGDLVTSFNGMLREIRVRDAALAAHRDSLEATVAMRTAELEKAKTEAEEANAAKSDFLATMSHEIRTPMNGMLVMAELISVSGLPPRLQRYASVLVNSGKSLLAIINDILDFSKIEAGKLTLEAVPMRPASLVDDILQLFNERAASKGLDLAAYIAADVPAVVAADPVRCNQILSNLVSNALKFTSSGGILVSVASRPSAESGRATLELSVKDTGIGIAADKVDTIFEAFSQADQSTTRKFGGTGIGLTICQRLARAMGGNIAVTSREGEGATFTVTIDVGVVEVCPLPAPHPGKRNGQIVIARAPSGPTVQALTDYARDYRWDVVAIPAEALSHATLAAARVIFADAADIPVLSRRMPDAFASDRQKVIAVFTGFGEGQKTARGMDCDLVLELPLAHREIVSAFDALALPRSAIAATRQHEDQTTASAKTAETQSFTGCRALVADDSAVNRELLSEALGRLGLDVTCVEDGERAIAAIKQSRFDIVFMDGSMPVMDGFSATRAIRDGERADARDPLPIIAVTAHIIGEKAGEWQRAGMNGCITKPFTLATLEACLVQHARHPMPASTRPAARLPAPHAVTSPEAKREAVTQVSAIPAIEAASPEHDWSEVPLIDEEAIHAMRDMQQPGDDFARRMVGLYDLHAPRALDEIEKLDLATVTDDALAKAAHALKSLSLSIGALRVAAVCEALEHEAMQGERMNAPAHVAALNRLLPPTLSALYAASAPRPEAIEASAASA